MTLSINVISRAIIWDFPASHCQETFNYYHHDSLFKGLFFWNSGQANDPVRSRNFLFFFFSRTSSTSLSTICWSWESTITCTVCTSSHPCASFRSERGGKVLSCMHRQFCRVDHTRHLLFPRFMFVWASMFVWAAMFSCLCCGDLITWLSCKDMPVGGGGLAVVGGCLEQDNAVTHKHLNTFKVLRK